MFVLPQNRSQPARAALEAEVIESVKLKHCVEAIEVSASFCMTQRAPETLFTSYTQTFKLISALFSPATPSQVEPIKRIPL